jgi:hypothetical protein
MTVSLSEDDASRAGAALLGMPGAVSETAGLFQMVPFLTIWNPPLELERSDQGQVVIALKPRDLRPIFVQLEAEKSRQLRDFLAAS